MGSYIGIDAGYSKTRGVLINEDGQILSKFNTGGSAIVGKPLKKSLSTLLDTINKLCILYHPKKVFSLSLYHSK